MSAFTDLLTGARNRALPDVGYWLIDPTGHVEWPSLIGPAKVSPQQFTKVSLRVFEKKRIVSVRIDEQRIGDRTIAARSVGWFSANKLRKDTTIKVKNLKYGLPDLKLTVSPGLHAELQVWMDQLEEKGLLVTKGTDRLSERELVENDPRIASMHQEADGFCDDSAFSQRLAWWIALDDPYIDDDMGCGSIHECDLKTILERLKDYVRLRETEREFTEVGCDYPPTL